MDADELRTTLERSGLTQYEAAVYLALVEREGGTATEIAEAADVPQARIYDVLRDLERRGYVDTYEQGTLRVQARDPEEVVADLESFARDLTDAAGEIEDRWEQPAMERQTVSVVKRFETVLEHANERVAEADNEVQLAVTPDRLGPLVAALRDAVERDVVVKLTLMPPGEPDRTAVSADDVAAALDVAFDAVATEVRYCRIPNPFVLLADRTSVCFAPLSAVRTPNEYGVLVEDYALSTVFDWYFHTALWEYWDVLHSARDDSLPRTYTSIRECLRDVDPLVESGRRVVLAVRGTDRETGEERNLVGEVANVRYTAAEGDGSPPLRQFLDEATIELSTEGGTYEVGGWGSIFEDVEARRITVEAVE